MYLWKTNKLAEDFGNKKVSQKESLKYFITLSILGILATFSMELWPSEAPSESQSLYIYIQYISVAFITVVGIYFCFEKNNKVDGKDFIERFICFSLPVGIKAFVFITVLLVGFGFLKELLSSGAAEAYFESPSFVVKYEIFYNLYFFQSLYKAISKINSNDDITNSEESVTV